MYLFSKGLKPPTFEAKYRVKDPAVLLKQRGRVRPKNKVVFGVKGKMVEGVGEVGEGGRMGEKLAEIGVAGRCFVGNVEILKGCTLKELEKFRGSDGNLYVRVEEADA